VNDGTDLMSTLDALACIAVTNDGNECANRSLRALFHLAQQDHVIRYHLLRIIKDSRTGVEVRLAACTLLRYVADGSVRQELLRQVVDGWEKTDMGGQFWALVELGDPEFLRWLEGIIRDLPSDDMRKIWLEEQAQRVRVQQDPAELLRTIRSDQRTIERWWLVRQGMRHGFPKTDIADAVKEYLGKAKRGEIRADGELLTASDEYGLLTSQDRQEYVGLEGPKAIADPPGPKWATLVDEKAKRFWKVESK